MIRPALIPSTTRHLVARVATAALKPVVGPSHAARRQGTAYPVHRKWLHIASVHELSDPASDGRLVSVRDKPLSGSEQVHAVPGADVADRAAGSAVESLQERSRWPPVTTSASLRAWPTVQAEAETGVQWRLLGGARAAGWRCLARSPRLRLSEAPRAPAPSELVRRTSECSRPGPARGPTARRRNLADRQARARRARLRQGRARRTTAHDDGERHREDGPAIEYADCGKEWWRDGKLTTLEAALPRARASVEYVEAGRTIEAMARASAQARRCAISNRPEGMAERPARAMSRSGQWSFRREREVDLRLPYGQGERSHREARTGRKRAVRRGPRLHARFRAFSFDASAGARPHGPLLERQQQAP